MSWSERNRYRYRVYRPEQLYDYEFIMLLQKTGATLEDIRQLRAQMDAPSVINHIEDVIEQLRLEAQHLLNLANDFEQQVKEAKEIEAAPKATLIVGVEPALTLSCVTIDRPSEDHHLAITLRSCVTKGNAMCSQLACYLRPKVCSPLD